VLLAALSGRRRGAATVDRSDPVHWGHFRNRALSVAAGTDPALELWRRNPDRLHGVGGAPSPLRHDGERLDSLFKLRAGRDGDRFLSYGCEHTRQCDGRDGSALDGPNAAGLFRLWPRANVRQLDGRTAGGAFWQ